MPPESIELYIVSPADLLVAFLAWVAVTLLAVGFAVWVMRAGRPEGEPPAAPVECAETVELPRRSLHRPHTGTIHAPRDRHAGDDATVVIKRAVRQ